MNMTPEFEKYFEAQGWIMECQSPLEIRHEDGSFATYQAAKAVIREIKAEYDLEHGVQSESTVDQLNNNIAEIIKINETVQQYVQTAQEQSLKDEEIKNEGGFSYEGYKLWDDTYSLVFSEQISRRVGHLLDEMNMRLEYYDPDTSYQEDVCAYASALNEKADLLAKLQTNDNTKRNHRRF